MFSWFSTRDGDVYFEDDSAVADLYLPVPTVTAQRRAYPSTRETHEKFPGVLRNSQSLFCSAEHALDLPSLRRNGRPDPPPSAHVQTPTAAEEKIYHKQDLPS